MSSLDIKNELKGVKNFAGVILLTELNNLRVFHTPVGFISNFDGHWFSILVTENEIEIFDSLGMVNY